MLSVQSILYFLVTSTELYIQFLLRSLVLSTCTEIIWKRNTLFKNNPSIFCSMHAGVVLWLLFARVTLSSSADIWRTGKEVMKYSLCLLFWDAEEMQTVVEISCKFQQVFCMSQLSHISVFWQDGHVKLQKSKVFLCILLLLRNNSLFPLSTENVSRINKAVWSEVMLKIFLKKQ